MMNTDASERTGVPQGFSLVIFFYHILLAKAISNSVSRVHPSTVNSSCFHVGLLVLMLMEAESKQEQLLAMQMCVENREQLPVD